MLKPHDLTGDDYNKAQVILKTLEIGILSIEQEYQIILGKEEVEHVKLISIVCFKRCWQFKNADIIRNSVKNTMVNSLAGNTGDKGTKIHRKQCKGKDDTLFALTNGIVKFERKGKDRKQVSIVPELAM